MTNQILTKITAYQIIDMINFRSEPIKPYIFLTCGLRDGSKVQSAFVLLDWIGVSIYLCNSVCTTLTCLATYTRQFGPAILPSRYIIASYRQVPSPTIQKSPALLAEGASGRGEERRLLLPGGGIQLRSNKGCVQLRYICCIFLCLLCSMMMI